MFRFISAIRNGSAVEEIERWRVKSDTDMLDGGGDILYPPLEALRFAVMYSHLDYARHILRTFGEEVLRVSLCCPLLLLSVRLNDEAMLKLLCEESRLIGGKVNINYVNSRGCDLMENGKTALHTAAELGYVNCTKVLLQHGANPTLKDSTRMTPLEKSCRKYRATLNNLRCCVELLKCEKQVQNELLPLLITLHDRVHVDGVCDVCKFVPTSVQPSSLEHLSKCSIRMTLGIHLPQIVKTLPLPFIVRKSISFQDNEDAT
ncbi:ankyrin repeat domain-containing protein 9-like [Haliotis cracherodii]|uniref:ankyrin repeat domain-containing protein 9-like n=1 Tax=Haliotis cracherodii TaxID=6455 RepID=UPI0039E78C71